MMLSAVEDCPNLLTLVVICLCLFTLKKWYWDECDMQEGFFCQDLLTYVPFHSFISPRTSELIEQDVLSWSRRKRRGRENSRMLNSDLSARLKSLLLLEDPSSSSSEPKKNDALLQRTQLEEISSNQQNTNSQETSSVSCAEQMMATAESAQKSLKEEQRNEEQKRAKNASLERRRVSYRRIKPKKFRQIHAALPFKRWEECLVALMRRYDTILTLTLRIAAAAEQSHCGIGF